MSSRGADRDDDGMLCLQDLKGLLASQHLRSDGAIVDALGRLLDGWNAVDARVDWPTFRCHFRKNSAQDGKNVNAAMEVAKKSAPRHRGATAREADRAGSLDAFNGIFEIAEEAAKLLEGAWTESAEAIGGFIRQAFNGNAARMSGA